MNRLTRDRIRRYLEAFDFAGLFTDAELGWDWPESKARLRVPTKSGFIEMDVIADKRGVKVLHAPPSAGGAIPASDERKVIEKAVTPLATEHLLIFTDAAKTRQVWLWTSRWPGKPISYRELVWEKGKANELVLQKLSSIAFTLSEEEALDITGVVERLRDSLDRDKVTKKFYEQFKVQKDAFRKFITGLTDGGLLDWYTSLMLNRLMFCYFLQRKGFLDGDTGYLRHRLDRVRDEIGEGQFHSFYKTFLRALFHDGLGKPKDERAFSPALKKLIGDIPYLNGGIFEEHRIEREHPDLHIPDKAFDRVFTFLDQFDWHLDDRPIASGKEINPEILGYVFEKYTNQKEMGAYYTKEDITDYIAKNCIIPFLLDAAGDKLGDSSWNLLRDDPDRYIYPAVGHGIFCDYPTNTKLDAPLPLPDYIEKGIDTSKPDLRKRRARWNESATSELGLPTEIWRETVARRQRCEELQRKLRAGGVCAVNALITLNLNIRQFAQDVVENAAPDLLLALFKAIRKVSVLDPTCGSGAFLFAALNILEPLYRASLDRMRALLGDWDARGDKSHPNYRKEFVSVLDQAARHPNENYFIFKSIIVHNLYGVDIMEEAVEICKLRLFLKLAAQLEPGQEIEPLPDIDFNIRAGNTLVGYATRDEVRRCMQEFGDGQMRLGVEDELQSYSRFEEAAENVDKAFQLFQRMQDEFGMNAAEFREQKRVLSERLQTLRDQLDRFIASDYDKRNLADAALQRWLAAYRPFHWFVEFFGILTGGGFDAIIGNPPYFEVKELKEYSLRGYECLEAGNIYAVVLERCAALGSEAGRQGFIVPVSSVSTDRYSPLQELLAKRSDHFSSFDDRPSRLFDGLEHIRLTIHLLNGRQPSLYSSRYNKWAAVSRDTLFQTLKLERSHPALIDGTFPKLSSSLEHGIIAKLNKQSPIGRHISKAGRQRIFYSRKVGYFLQVLDFEPRVFDGNGNRRPPSEFKELRFEKTAHASAALCCFNSSLFYWVTTVFSDCRHVNKREIEAMPLTLSEIEHSAADELTRLGNHLMTELKQNSITKQMKFKHDSLTVQCILPKSSKPTLDEIDTVLGEHYGFTEEELDFIINYDIKYRMGLSGGSGEEE